MTDVPNHMPPLPALRAFESVARLGSLTLAAAELNVTKSAVSHQIKALELDFGVQLLKRGGNFTRAEPTEIGLGLLIEVQKSLSMLEVACRRTRHCARIGERRILKISANASFSALWLTPRLGLFMRQFPELDVELNLHTAQNPAWKAKDIDVAFLHVRDGGPHRPELGDTPLMPEYIFPICSPSLILPQDRANKGVFQHQRFITEQHVSSPETTWLQWQARLGFGKQSWREPLKVNGMSAVVAACISGAGIGLGRSPLVCGDILEHRLCALFPELMLKSSWRYVLRTKPSRASDQSVNDFIDFCVRQGDVTTAAVEKLSS